MLRQGITFGVKSTIIRVQNLIYQVDKYFVFATSPFISIGAFLTISFCLFRLVISF